MPQAPKPVAKYVAWPMKGPPVVPGAVGAESAVEVVVGGCCGVEVEEGVEVVAGGGGGGGGVATSMGDFGMEGEGVGILEEDAEEDGGGLHFAEFCRLTVTSVAFEATRAAMARW